ncbi:MAG: hypothetical protein GX604_05075, partial [Actinobacteria bacterium]|nr:hypothetical protein [Actinomycetota bacterium]
MTWEASWGDPFAAYLRHFEGLIGDRRTGVTFDAVVKGIIGARSLVCERIAAQIEILMCNGLHPSVAPYGFGPSVPGVTPMIILTDNAAGRGPWGDPGRGAAEEAVSGDGAPEGKGGHAEDRCACQFGAFHALTAHPSVCYTRHKRDRLALGRLQ